MKQYSYLSVLLACTLFLCFSCSKDKDSEVGISYRISTQFTFTDEATESTFGTYIEEGFESMGLWGSAANFAENATAPSVDEAIAQCNRQAMAEYDKRLTSLTLDKLKTTIFDRHSAEFQLMGFASAEDLPITGFTVSFELFSFMTGMNLKTTSIDF